MWQSVQSILSICIYIIIICFLGCSEQTSQSSEISAEDIVGDPIVEITEETFGEENQSEDSQSLAVKREDNETEEILQEGIVVKGRAQPETDGNQTDEIIRSNLPPLEEGSEYKPLAFRDMMNFEYLVEWEKDGKDFDFSAYAQRVPKRLREKSGNMVAIEGFMIPTVVDENNEVKEFLLLPDQMSCCFGQTPEANGWVVVNASKGVEVMMDRIIRVTGQLTVEERWDEEFFVGLYHMTCDEITGPAL